MPESVPTIGPQLGCDSTAVRGYFEDNPLTEMGSDRPLGPTPPPLASRHTALYFTDDKTKIKLSNLFFYLTELPLGSDERSGSLMV